MQTDLFDKIEDAERIQIYSRLFHAVKLPFVWIFDLTLLPYWNRVLGFDSKAFLSKQSFAHLEAGIEKNIQIEFSNIALQRYKLLTGTPAEIKAWLNGPEGKMTTEQMWANLVSGKLTFRG